MIIVLTFIIAFLSSLLLHPKMVEIAKKQGITDKPNKRKLQREPVPVLGGLVVFFGITLGIGLTTFDISYRDFMLVFAMMVVMLYTGALDDVSGLSAAKRFLIEIFVTLMLIFSGGYAINDFHGLWGIELVSLWIAVPLTIITVVGIINAINLIDGVDGLSSGYCIMASAFFALYFWLDNDTAMASLAMGCIGALIPFFVYNVFGNKSKMFIGDGGTLLMGIILSIFVLRIISCHYMSFNTNILTESPTLDVRMARPFDVSNFGLVPFTLAILSLPVIDTLRVMISRILHHTSPFAPDKTHLHHAFIGCGLTHLMTTMSVLAMNFLIIILWYVLYKCGVSIDVQLYAVVGTAIAADLIVYYTCMRQAKRG